MAAAQEVSGDKERYFVTDKGLDLRAFADKQTRKMLKRVRGDGEEFGATQRTGQRSSNWVQKGYSRAP